MAAPDTDGFAERFSVDVSMPIVSLSRAGADAYAVTDKEDPRATIYALVHNPDVPWRRTVAESLLKNQIQNLLCPIAQGALNLNLRGGAVTRLVTIVPYPKGGPLADRQGNRHPLVSERSLRENIIGDLAAGLRELHERDILHRAITPSNLFFMSDSVDSIIFGECFTEPEGWGQPDAYEPIERALAPKNARGAGIAADDLFALGATILSLITGKPAGALHVGEEPLIEARIAKGSYRALLGDYELQGIMSQLLRGLLDDDPSRRWTVHDVRMWFDGHRPAPRQSGQSWDISKPVRFAGENYHDRRSLSVAMQKNKTEAIRFLRSVDYGEWFRNNITAQDYTDRSERTLRTSPADASNPDDANLAKVCLHLYPCGPISYRGVTMQLDGLGGAIADFFKSDDEVSLGVTQELLNSGLASQMLDIAIEHQPSLKRCQMQLHSAMETARRTTLGKGMERVLYDLNISMPCRSSRVSTQYVDSAPALALAIEASGDKGGLDLLDRHAAAFLGSRDNMLDPQIQNLSGSDSRVGGRALTLLDIFARLQTKHGLKPLPGLARAIADRIEPALRAMHNKRNRDGLKARLQRMAAAGDLSRMSMDLDLDRALREDAQAYSRARGLYQRMERDRAILSRPVSPNEPSAQHMGYQGAAVLGFLLAVGTAFVWLVRG